MESRQLQDLRQYGWLAEIIPEKFNVIGIPIPLNQVPYDVRALILRDMGHGPRLFTLDDAEELISGLEALTEESDFNLRKTLQTIKPPKVLDPMDEYFMIHKN